MSLPALPEGYRWRLVRTTNQYADAGYIDFLLLEKKNWLGIWTTKARRTANSGFTSPEEAAKKIVQSYFQTNDPNSSRLGVIK